MCVLNICVNNEHCIRYHLAGESTFLQVPILKNVCWLCLS